MVCPCCMFSPSSKRSLKKCFPPYRLCHFLHSRKFRSCYEREKGTGTSSSDCDVDVVDDDDDDDDDDEADDDGDDEEDDDEDGDSDDHEINNHINNDEARRAGVSLPHPPLAAESPPPSSSAPPPPPGLSAPAVSCNIVETSLESLQTEQGVRKLFADLDLVVSEERTWRVVEAGATNSRDDEKRRTVPLEYCRQRIINAGW